MAFTTGLFGRLRAYVFITMMTMSAFVLFVCLMIIMPIKPLSLKLYRDLVGCLLRIAIPAFLLPATLAGACEYESRMCAHGIAPGTAAPSSRAPASAPLQKAE